MLCSPAAFGSGRAMAIEATAFLTARVRWFKMLLTVSIAHFLRGPCSLSPQVAEVITAMTTNSPLLDAAGKLPSPDTPRDSIVSFASVHHSLAPKAQGYADKYSQFVINYIVEWDRIITTRVEKGLKTAEDLRRDYDHYQKKAESLRASANSALAKGKMVDNKSQDKLARNEEKLVAAKASYDKFATDMCIYIEELTERSWKDLHPCLVKMAQFDMTISKEEATCFGQMDHVVNQLKKLGEQYKLQASGRLKELETQQPAILSTREANAQPSLTNGNTFGMGSGSFGLGSGSVGAGSVPGGDSWSQHQYLPPGSVAPQGMGGFPVAIAMAPASHMSRETSAQSFSGSFGGGSAHGSVGGPMNASDMLAIANSAAPPPTMDDLNFAAQRSLTISTSQQSNYGYQFNDDASNASSNSMPIAPPPMGAPPPLPPSGYCSPMANPYGFNSSVPIPSYGGSSPMSYGQPPPMTFGAPPPMSYGAPSPTYSSNLYGAPPSF